MTKLKGSEKQIEWAENIRDKWIDQINEIISISQNRVDRCSMPQKWVDHVKKEAKTFLKGIENASKSGDFINAREKDLGMILEAKAIKTYK